MALFDQQTLIERAKREQISKRSVSMEGLIKESVEASARMSSFDIFLSHSYLDRKIIIGIKLALEDLGYSVYVDWIDDQQLSRLEVSKSTAQTLRARMTQSRSLLYATTQNAENSKWMPWELGLMDGLKQKAAILPIALNPNQPEEYRGQEYLGVYPYVVNTGGTLFVHRTLTEYMSFSRWIAGQHI
ncbi:TIR domain-containing protein [Fluviicoccus keumensis]|uniref:TIR domain-containing protein n=1 Tax=Fluviicoccus keumensis TaxID=1435465 RepID=A0A4Q7ZBJ5_9GAMM|nr:TIR domain-containing protein [Fluviicoccus keumensis]RZU47960.1 TIR domain-containing protein [Fluviicoccus keumensis]